MPENPISFGGEQDPTDVCRQMGFKCDNGALIIPELPDRMEQRQAERFCGGAACKCSDTPAAKDLVNIYFSYPQSPFLPSAYQHFC